MMERAAQIEPPAPHISLARLHSPGCLLANDELGQLGRQDGADCITILTVESVAVGQRNLSVGEAVGAQGLSGKQPNITRPTTG